MKKKICYFLSRRHFYQEINEIFLKSIFWIFISKCYKEKNGQERKQFIVKWIPAMNNNRFLFFVIPQIKPLSNGETMLIPVKNNQFYKFRYSTRWLIAKRHLENIEESKRRSVVKSFRTFVRLKIIKETDKQSTSFIAYILYY